MAGSRASTDAEQEWLEGEPKVLVFDVNETLIDFEALQPLFQSLFGDEKALREWLAQLIMYSMTIKLSGLYVDYFSLGEGLLSLVGDIHEVAVCDAHIDELRRGMMTMPAHPDVKQGLEQLRDAGFRLVTLTNSPTNPDGPSPLEHAGLAGFFEQPFSIESARAYKPAAQVYHLVSQTLKVPPSNCMMVAAHVWDTVGAQSTGLTAALLTRPGNAPLLIDGLPQPNLVAPDLPTIADQLIARWR
jgi:2-haloacid dehalogenase